MKTLSEYNKEYCKNVYCIDSDKRKRAGAVCDICGEELFLVFPNVVLMSMPPKREVECKNKHKDYQIC